MPKVKLTIEVGANAQTVYDKAIDIANCAQFIEGIDSVEMLTDGPVGPGTRWRETRTFFGKEAVEEMTIKEAARPDYYTVTAFSHGTSYLTRFDFTENGETTTITSIFEAKPESLPAKLMSFLGFLMMGAVKKALQKDLEDLKSAIERG